MTQPFAVRSAVEMRFRSVAAEHDSLSKPLNSSRAANARSKHGDVDPFPPTPIPKKLPLYSPPGVVLKLAIGFAFLTQGYRLPSCFRQGPLCVLSGVVAHKRALPFPSSDVQVAILPSICRPSVAIGRLVFGTNHGTDYDRVDVSHRLAFALCRLRYVNF